MEASAFTKLGSDLINWCLFVSFKVDVDVFTLCFDQCGSLEVLDAFCRPEDEENRLHQSKENSDQQEDGSLSVKSVFFDLSSFCFDGTLQSNEQDNYDETIIREAEKGQTQTLNGANGFPGSVCEVNQTCKE